MEINGLPLHPLLVHAVVVLVPGAAVLGLAFAALPRFRERLAWPAAAGALVALVLVQAAIMSGTDLRDSFKLDGPEVATHEDWARLLRWAALAFAAVTVGSAWLVRQPKHGGTLVRLALGLVGLAALAVLVLAFLTGEAGARAVWG